jgi:hypothetical protein
MPPGPYAASTFALEPISEAMAGEVKQLNIRVATSSLESCVQDPGVQTRGG